MDTSNVTLWFNEKIPKSVDFADFFGEDLKKCFIRFGLNPEIYQNPKENGKGHQIVILASDDSSSEDFIARVKSMSGKSNLVFLLIEPFVSDKINVSQFNQPILFWDKLYATDEIRLFRRDNQETKANYWEKAIDLVVEIANQTASVDSENKQEKIYLSQDLISYNAEIDNLKRDLNDLGFDVTPNSVLSNNYDECTIQIKEALKSVRLIIHFIPPIYHTLFVNQHLSLAELQCNLSADYIEKSSTKPHRIIWIPSAYEITDEENQVFVEKIQRDENQTRNTMILKSSIEDLKKYYRIILVEEMSDSNNSFESTDVYVVMDKLSNGEYSKLKKVFEAQKLTVSDNFSGITYSQHLTQLAKAKVVVVCYSQKNEQWLKVKINDIQKAKGLDTFNPFERLMLLKSDKELDVKEYKDFFNAVLDDVSQISS